MGVGIGIKILEIPESAECPCWKIHIASHSKCFLRPFFVWYFVQVKSLLYSPIEGTIQVPCARGAKVSIGLSPYNSRGGPCRRRCTQLELIYLVRSSRFSAVHGLKWDLK